MFVSVIAVIVYRVVATIDYCPNMSAGACMFVTTVVSSLLNTISILILGRVGIIFNIHVFNDSFCWGQAAQFWTILNF